MALGYVFVYQATKFVVLYRFLPKTSFEKYYRILHIFREEKNHLPGVSRTSHFHLAPQVEPFHEVASLYSWHFYHIIHCNTGELTRDCPCSWLMPPGLVLSEKQTSKAFTKKLASPLAITISLKTLMVDNP